MNRQSSDHFPQFAHLGDATQFVERIIDIVDRIALFEDFEREDIRRLAASLPCYRARGGAAILTEGDEGDFLVLLISGLVEIVKRDAVGRNKSVGSAGAGKILGEMSMIDGQPRAASCLAVEDTVFAVLDRERLTGIIADDPRLGIKVLIELVQLLSQRLRQATAQLADQIDV